MTREVKGIILSRLIIFITIILVPISIFLIFILVDFRLWFTDNRVITFWVIKVLCPLVFSVAWFFFLVLFANRFSETIDSMDKVVGVVPLRLKFFFGLNALFILLIFVFPLITPLIAILSFASMAWRLTTFRKKSWDESDVSVFTKFLMVAASILPIFCTICIIPEYFRLALFLWNRIWLPLLEYIYITSYCLCTALAIGSFFILIANKGVSEYEQIYYHPDELKVNLTYIKVFEFFLFLFFLFLALLSLDLILLFYYAGFVIVAIVSIVNFISGRRRNRKFKGHVLGYLLAAVFMGSNLLLFNEALAEVIQLWSLVISAALFILVFFITFFKIEESEL
ncbi:MAG: hypothetical protein GF383_06480 [Candidatus Lokiarchaeota archaeon]|nr:hypothetical protein [Candidatus Lokiarchaeota archaeon]MBD3339701.1 hypothetical protein [Candidatus Lokiarchaeota archaeon]